MNIIERLKDGAKLYTELRGQTNAVEFDIQLGKLLKERSIVLVLDFSGETARFGLPQAPKEDEPLPRSREVLSLRKPRKNQYTFDKEGRKKCSVCNRRRGRSRFMYSGKTWGKCFDCREQQ